MAHYAARSFTLLLFLVSYLTIAIAMALPQEIVYIKVTTITLGPGEHAPTSLPFPPNTNFHFEEHVDDTQYTSPEPIPNNKPVVKHESNAHIQHQDQQQQQQQPKTSPSPIIQAVTPSSSPDTSTDSTTTTTGGDTPPDDTMASVLQKHNHYRSLHKVDPLVWSNDLASSAAQANANNHCAMNHINPLVDHVGENLYGAPDAGAVDHWYGEVDVYDWGDPGFSKATGHFTQVVWKGTTKLGCDNACGQIMRCQYLEPGNMAGEFPDNVPKVGGGT